MNVAYSSRNFLDRIAECGTKVQSHHVTNLESPMIDQMDQWVCELAAEKPKLAAVVKCRYIDVGNIRDQAIKMGLPKSTYHHCFKRAVVEISKKLNQLH